jgi:hypothetical protein
LPAGLARPADVPGVLLVDDLAPIGACVEDIELVIECSEESEWRDRIVFLPFK